VRAVHAVAAASAPATEATPDATKTASAARSGMVERTGSGRRDGGSVMAASERPITRRDAGRPRSVYRRVHGPPECSP
jgi:hypothetical protein